MKRRLAAGLAVIALAFVGVAAAGTVNLGGTGANTNCGGGGFLAINTQVGSGNPTIVPSGDWTLKTWSVAGGSGGIVGLRILHPTGVADQYRILFATGTKTLTPGVLNAFTGGAGYQLNLSAVLDSGSAQIPHAGYCSAAGNTWPDGTAIVQGAFLYLVYQQPTTDSHYTGATPAIYVKGKGITCDPPPAGYTQQGYAGNDLSVPDGLYPFYAPPS